MEKVRSSEAPSFGPTLAPGTVVGGYDVLRCIGTGGVGVVYEARHRRLDKPVAVKTLHVGLAQDPKMRERFLREGRMAAKLSHPHVVDVSDVALEGEIPYLVMELLRGEDLSALIAREGPLSVERTIDLLIPLISALAVAHDCGIVHRDLKPQNVFLSVTAMGTIVPKILDFGISKYQVDPVTDLTQSRAILGTPHYMSPEQACGARCIDHRSDQFSLGVVAYECISGLRPFAGDSLLAVLNAVTQDEPPPLRSFSPEVPEQLDAIIARMTAKLPKERFGNMRDLGQAFLPYASSRVRFAFEHDFIATSTASIVSSGAVGPCLASNTERCTPYPWAIGRRIGSSWRRWRLGIGAATVIATGFTLIHIARSGNERARLSGSAPRWVELPSAGALPAFTLTPPLPSFLALRLSVTPPQSAPGIAAYEQDLEATTPRIRSRQSGAQRARTRQSLPQRAVAIPMTPMATNAARETDASDAGPTSATAGHNGDPALTAQGSQSYLEALPFRRGVNGAPILP